MRDHRRRYRPVHERSPWPRRAGCAAALIGVVALVALRGSPPAVVAPTAPLGQMCPVLEALVVLLGEGLPPPVGGTPEQIEATLQANALLAQRREAIMGLTATREMGC